MARPGLVAALAALALVVALALALAALAGGRRGRRARARRERFEAEAGGLNPTGRRLLDTTCRVECADCPGGEYSMGFSSGLERASASEPNGCVFMRAEPIVGVLAPGQGGAVPDLLGCSPANRVAFDPAVMLDLSVANVSGRQACLASFRPGLESAAYASYEAALRTGDVVASAPYQERLALWEANEERIHGEPGGYIYQIADRTRMVYGPAEPREGDAVTPGAVYDLEAKLTEAQEGAAREQGLWDACELRYATEYTNPGACRDKRRECREVDLPAARAENVRLTGILNAERAKADAVAADIAANYVTNAACDAAKAARYQHGVAEEEKLYANWVSRPQCDAIVAAERKKWDDE